MQVGDLKMIDETWFLLYDGTSVDGTWGHPHYCGRTTDKEVAKYHYEKCEENPYSIGKVVAITDTREIRINWETDWSRL